MKLKRNGGGFLRSKCALVLLISPISLLPASSLADGTKTKNTTTTKAATKPSYFEKDKQGILWFRQGSDGRTPYSASLTLSAVKDNIVITVTANTKHIKDAVGLAQKIQAEMLKLPNAPKEIPIVTWEDDLPGVAYTFYTDGLRYGLDSSNDKGVYKPSGAKKVFRDVVPYFDILRSKYVPSGKWGKHQEGWKALEIIKAPASENPNPKEISNVK